MINDKSKRSKLSIMENINKRLEAEILKVPTGELRNLMCDANIELYSQRKLFLIEHRYRQFTGVVHGIIGVFNESQLESALNDIKGKFKDEGARLVLEEQPNDKHSGYLEFDDDNESSFYVAEYRTNEFIADFKI